MRGHKTIDLGDQQIMVFELTLGIVREALVSMPDDLAKLTIKELMTNHWLDLLAILKGTVTTPTGEQVNLNDLAIADTMQVLSAFREVNAAFFGMLAGMLPNLVASVAPRLTDPLSSSPNAATAASGNTHGPSS